MPGHWLGVPGTPGRPGCFQKSPENPCPPNLGGDGSPPQFEGWIFRNHLFYSAFWGSLPNFGGWKISPPKFRGYGFSGSLALLVGLPREGLGSVQVGGGGWFLSVKHRAGESEIWPTNAPTKALPQVLTRVLTQVYTRVPTKVGFLCVIVPYKGSHSSAHVSAHAGAHASVHEVVWSYVTWSVFTCSVPYQFLWKKEDGVLGLGQTLDPASQCTRVYQNHPSANYPSTSPRDRKEIGDRTLKSTKIRGVPKSEFSGSQKGGIKGDVKRGEVTGEWTRPEGEREGGEMRKKGRGKGARNRTRKTLILVPLWFWYPSDLGTLYNSGLWRFLPLPRRIARFLRPQDARFPLRRKSLANGDFLRD